MLPSAHIWQVFLFWRSFCKTKAWLKYELGANPRLERRRNTINTLFTTDWESSETPADQSTWGQCSTALRSYTMLINLRSRLWRWAFEEPVFYDTVWSSIPVGFNGNEHVPLWSPEEHACVLTDVSPLFVFRSWLWNSRTSGVRASVALQTLKLMTCCLF